MKKFLKKANRGLLLGAIAIIVLLIYVISDYKSFSSEKSTIKTTLENYIADYYEKMSQRDYEAVEKLIKEVWTEKPVMSGDSYSYYTDKKSIAQYYETVGKNDVKAGDFENPKYDIKSISIRKSGPGMAFATVIYELEIEGEANQGISGPFEDYAQGTSYMYEEDVNDENTYIYEMEYEIEVYLMKEDGQWKISQSSDWGYCTDAYVKGDE